MTLLVDHQIRRLAERGMIEDFYDEPYQPGLSAGLTSCGYDARLSSEFYLIRGDMWGWIDPLRGVIDAEMENVSICDDDVCVLNPGDFILGRTIETFNMPDNVAAVCWGKSTYARCGIHVNVTPLEPGWCGQVTLEIHNQAPNSCKRHATRAWLVRAGDARDSQPGTESGRTSPRTRDLPVPIPPPGGASRDHIRGQRRQIPGPGRRDYCEGQWR